MSEETKTADVSPKDLITPDKIDWNAAGSEEFKEGGHFVYAEMLPHIEYYKNQLTQQQEVNAELKQQLSDKDTAWILAYNTAKRRGEKIKELKKQNAELVDDLNLKIQDLNRQIPRYNDIAEGHRFQGKIELYQDAKTTAIVYGQIANQLNELISKHTT